MIKSIYNFYTKMMHDIRNYFPVIMKSVRKALVNILIVFVIIVSFPFLSLILWLDGYHEKD